MRLDPHPAGQYAKLTPPTLEDPLRRERLFALLDALRRKFPVIWLTAPPGAGKTTLAASYLACAAAPPVWYRLDPDDADPSCLFYFLAQALPGVTLALPRLPPMPPADLRRCARLFFRDFYARLPAGSTLVLDNAHEFDWEQAGDLLEIAFNEIPPGRTLLALSRDPPPSRLARLQLEELLTVLGWEELRFNRGEARALARSEGAREPHGPEWPEQAEGWAAGIVMLRDERNGCQAVFRYFSGEILLRMAAPSQRLLLMLSLLPGATAEDALLLTDAPEAAGLLEQLHASRRFVERREGSPPIFHFHPLFRRFLQQEARCRFAPAELAMLMERAAAILDGRGQGEEAALLYRDAGAFDALAALLLRHAPGMLANGGDAWCNWCTWLSWLPPASLETHPWLWYWQGKLLLGIDSAQAGLALQRAEQAFHATGDSGARLLAVTAIIDQLAYWQGGGDCAALLAWTQVLKQAAQGLAACTSLDADTVCRIQSRLALALATATPDAPELAAAIQRTRDALPLAGDPEARLGAGAALLQCRNWLDPAGAGRIMSELAPLADDPCIAPATRAWWHLQTAACCLDLAGDPGSAHVALERAQALLVEFGLRCAALPLEITRLAALLASGDLAAGQKSLARLRTLPATGSRNGQFQLAMAEAMLLMHNGDPQAALLCAEEILLEQGGTLPPNPPLHYRMAGALYAQAGSGSAADAWYARAVHHAHGHERERTEVERGLVAAHGASLAGDNARAAGLLRSALASHCRHGLQAFLPRHPQLAGSLAALALREKVEVAHVRAIIRRQHLLPPDSLTPDWPWPVAVRTLGKLELVLDGNIVKASGKVPQRPLMLLKALLCGGEAGKLQAIIADQLWPETEFAKSAVNVTIHRLRKLLGNDAAVTVASGTVALNRNLVWSDVSALGRVCSQVENLPGEACPEEVRRLSGTLLDLYRGPFCDGEESSWLMAARDRCRNHFLAAVSGLGKRLEAHGAWSDAIHLYLHALDTEPLAEAIHRGLMRCAHARNDPAAAFSAYRRCRDTLSIVLSRQPSAETQKLAIALGLL